MKKIYQVILILGMFYSNILVSQTTAYQPFPEDYGRWVMEIICSNNYYNSCLEDRRFEQYETSGDTIIGSYTYKKVTVAKSSQPYWVNPMTFGSRKYSFAYRNDIPNKKVYIYHNFPSPNGGYMDGEELWYDFNLSAGDSLYSDGTTIKISSIDSALICNQNQKTFHFDFLDGRPITPQFIEGIGCDGNFITPDLTFEYRLDVNFYYNTTFYCTVTAVNELSESTNQLDLFPNPVENTLQIKYKDHNKHSPEHYTIIDCLGRVVLSGTYSGSSIDVAQLEPGVYILSIQDKEKNMFQNKFVKQ